MPQTATTTSENPLHFKTLQKETRYKDHYSKSLAQWDVTHSTFYVQTSFGDTHVVACGPENGEPLVLLHAMGFSSTVWHPNIATLAEQHRVYALDFIGDLNNSRPSNLPASLEQCAQWLEETLTALQIKDFTLGGISYGAFQAINYAGHAPQRVKKLFLLSPAASFVPLHKAFINRIILMAALPVKWNVNLFLRWLSRHRLNKLLAEQFYAAFKYGTLSLRVAPSVYSDEELHRLTMPVLLLLGDQEVISDAPSAFARANGLGLDLQVEMVSGVGHMMNLEKPDEVNSKLDLFLRGDPT
ncbi:alpha/beta fold hydrolase [Paenibacillus gorillae]|uniref:alpha/beta fold hydrolase n=1 Tax=Paenibacillus gorillae TaxID=1243662 RepID=UPI0004B3E398|nr:alpha/beta fold hydrolase [Paenibacillus gorillae]